LNRWLNRIGLILMAVGVSTLVAFFAPYVIEPLRTLEQPFFKNAVEPAYTFPIFLLALVFFFLGGFLALKGKTLSRTEKRATAHLVRAIYRTKDWYSWARYMYIRQVENQVIISERTARLNRQRVRMGILVLSAGILMTVVYYVITPMRGDNYAADYATATALHLVNPSISSGCNAINQLDSYYLFHVQYLPLLPGMDDEASEYKKGETITLDATGSFVVSVSDSSTNSKIEIPSYNRSMSYTIPKTGKYRFDAQTSMGLQQDFTVHCK